KMRLTGERPGDEAAADASIAGRPEFLIDPLLIAVAKTDDAQAARFRDRLCQRSTGCSPHRGKKNWMADTELLGKLFAKRHRVCPYRMRKNPLCAVSRHLTASALACAIWASSLNPRPHANPGPPKCDELRPVPIVDCYCIKLDKHCIQREHSQADVDQMVQDLSESANPFRMAEPGLKS